MGIAKVGVFREWPGFNCGVALKPGLPDVSPGSIRCDDVGIVLTSGFQHRLVGARPGIRAGPIPGIGLKDEGLGIDFVVQPSVQDGLLVAFEHLQAEDSPWKTGGTVLDQCSLEGVDVHVAMKFADQDHISPTDAFHEVGPGGDPAGISFEHR